jgi:hypothetical protein
MMQIPHLTWYYVIASAETAYLYRLWKNREHCRNVVRTSVRLHDHELTCRNIRLITMGTRCILFSTEAREFVSTLVGAPVWNYCTQLGQSIRLKFQPSLNRPLNRWNSGTSCSSTYSLPRQASYPLIIMFCIIFIYNNSPGHSLSCEMRHASCSLMTARNS